MNPFEDWVWNAENENKGIARFILSAVLVAVCIVLAVVLVTLLFLWNWQVPAFWLGVLLGWLVWWTVTP